MWHNLKSFTSEVLETAKDLKAHISEITSVDNLDNPDTSTWDEEDRTEKLQELNDQHLNRLDKRIQALQEELRCTEEKYFRDVNKLTDQVQQLQTALATQTQLLKEKEGEVDWATQSYQSQLQDLARAKSKLQRDVEELSEENRQMPALQDEIKGLNSQVASLQRELSQSNEQLDATSLLNVQLKAELDKERMHQEEHIDRAFFLQFLEMYNNNIANFKLREEMLSSLVSQLGLTPAEQDRLGIETKVPKLKLPATMEGSFLDSFKHYLLDG